MSSNPDKPHCSHPTRRGKPCRAQVVRGTDPPLCSFHSGRTVVPQPEGDERCSAPTLSGKPCRARAIRGTEPRLCVFHAGPTLPLPLGDRRSVPTPTRGRQVPEGQVSDPASTTSVDRRCTALRKNGERCRAWAARHTDPPLCATHAGRSCRPPYPPANSHRCSFTTKRGARCRGWALPGTDPPACSVHAGRYRSLMALGEGATPCSFRTTRNRPCRAAALPGTDPPACPVHAGLWHPKGAPQRNLYGWKHGAYSGHLYDGLAEVYELVPGEGLGAEIAAARVVTRRLLGALTEAERLWKKGRLSGSAYASLFPLFFHAVKTVSRLVLAEHELRQAEAKSRQFEKSLLQMEDEVDGADEEGTDES